jgi:hypothetical protein
MHVSELIKMGPCSNNVCGYGFNLHMRSYGKHTYNGEWMGENPLRCTTQGWKHIKVEYFSTYVDSILMLK